MADLASDQDSYCFAARGHDPVRPASAQSQSARLRLSPAFAGGDLERNLSGRWTGSLPSSCRRSLPTMFMRFLNTVLLLQSGRMRPDWQSLRSSEASSPSTFKKLFRPANRPETVRDGVSVRHNYRRWILDARLRGHDSRVCHSITSSAVANSVGGTVMPSIRAVRALTTSSNFDDCTTGRSAVFAPLRMRPA